MRLRLPAAALAFLCAAPLSAQHTARPELSLGVFAGGNVPTGRAGDIYDNGYLVGGLAELRTPLRWLAVRADVGYRDLGGSSQTVFDAVDRAIGSVDVSRSMLSGTANVVLRLPNAHTPVRPYALAGIGWYQLRSHIASDVVSSDVVGGGRRLMGARGVDTGLGAESTLGRATLFAEARYERIGTGPLHMVPVVVGLRVH